MTQLLLRHLLVLGAAWLLARLLRNHSASLRHALWVVALAACLLLPALLHAPVELSAQASTSAFFTTQNGQVAASGLADIGGGETSMTVRAVRHWVLLAWTIYITIALVIIMRWCIGLRRAVRLARQGHQSGAVPGMTVITVDGVGPLTFGWPRATIIVPSADLHEHGLALRHELAHVQRADFLWQFVATLACAMWWFSPAVWFAARAMRREAEYACDDRVLEGGVSPASYADSLLSVAGMKSRAMDDATSLMHLIKETELGNRISAVLDGSRDRRTVRPSSVAVLAILLLPTVLFLARPVASDGAEAGGALSGMRIVLDPGHGGKDPGAVADGMRESDVTLEVAQRARRLLEQAGAEVTLTRESDQFVGLRERAESSADRDLFVSIHLDSAVAEQSGRHLHHPEVLFNDSSGIQGAQALARELYIRNGDSSGLDDEAENVRRASFIVLREAQSPAFLVNVGWMSSARDRARLRDPQALDDVARGLARGVAAILDSNQD